MYIQDHINYRTMSEKECSKERHDRSAITGAWWPITHSGDVIVADYLSLTCKLDKTLVDIPQYGGVKWLNVVWVPNKLIDSHVDG